MNILSYIRLAVIVSVLAATPANAQDLPEAAGKGTVIAICGACHNISTVVAKRRPLDDWRYTIEGMVSRGANGSDAELAIVLRYLTGHFGTVNVNAAPATELEAVLPISQAAADAIV